MYLHKVWCREPEVTSKPQNFITSCVLLQNGQAAPKTHNAEHIGVGLLNVPQHIANMGLSDLIEGMRHQDTSLSGY